VAKKASTAYGFSLISKRSVASPEKVSKEKGLLKCFGVGHGNQMLYDQAQLLKASLEASLLSSSQTEREELQSMAIDILTYLESDLQNKGGGGAFYSAEDADSLPSNEDTIKKGLWSDNPLPARLSRRLIFVFWEPQRERFTSGRARKST
jgi:hypothetical protein